MPREREIDRKSLRKRSKSRGPRKSSSSELNKAITNIKKSLANAEQKINQEFASRVTPESVFLAGAELYAKRIALNHQAQQDENKSLIRHMEGQLFLPPPVDQELAITTTTHTKNEAISIDKTNLEVLYSYDNYAESRQSSIKSREGEDDERILRAKIKALSASLETMETDKIRLAEKNKKALKSVLTEMIKAEKNFKKVCAALEETNQHLIEKNRIKQDRIDNIERALETKDEELQSKINQILSLRTELEEIQQCLLAQGDEAKVESLEKNINDQKVIIMALTDEASRLKKKLISLKTTSYPTEDVAELENENLAMAKELECNLSQINTLEAASKEKDDEINKKNHEIKDLQAKLDKTQVISNENIYLKEMLLKLYDANTDQKRCITQISNESDDLKAEVKSLKKSVSAKTSKKTESSSREQSFETTKNLVQSLMKEIYSLSIENSALYKELRRKHNDDSVDTSSLRGKILELDTSSTSPVSVLAEVEKEIQSLKDNIIAGMKDDEDTDLPTNPTETFHAINIDTTNVPLLEKNSREYDEFSEPSFGDIADFKGNIEEEKKNFGSLKKQLFSGGGAGVHDDGWVDF